MCFRRCGIFKLLGKFQAGLPIAPSLRFNIRLAEVVGFFRGKLWVCHGWILVIGWDDWKFWEQPWPISAWLKCLSPSGAHHANKAAEVQLRRRSGFDATRFGRC